MRVLTIVSLIVAGTLTASGTTITLDDRPQPRVPVANDWSAAGQNAHNTRYAAREEAIGAGNVAQLNPRWVFTAGGDINATPAVVHGVVYVPDAGGTLWAIRSSDGAALWSKRISDYTGTPGTGSRTTPAIAGDLLVFGSGFTIESPAGSLVIGVDRNTGAMRWKTQVDANPRSKITGAPVIDNGVVYIGVSSSEEILPPPHTFRGSIVALRADTGQILWQTYTAPLGYTGNAIWGSTPVVDNRRGLVYIATGNNYTVPEGVCETPVDTGCTPPAPDDYVDSVIALDVRTGAVRWDLRTLPADSNSAPDPLPGTDYDFGSGPNLFTTIVNGRRKDLLGIGQKSGIYWALDPSTGAVVWKTQVGPGGDFGGIQWGSATDGHRVYVAVANSDHVPFAIETPTGETVTVTGGVWAALDAATGRILWRTPDPQGAIDMGYVSAANGVVYAGSAAGTGDNMYALDAATGEILWRFPSGGSVVAGAAIVDGSVYWGSGYHIGASNNKLYAFDLR